MTHTPQTGPETARKITVQVRFYRGEVLAESYWEVRVKGRQPNGATEIYPAECHDHAQEMARDIRKEIRADRLKKP